MLNIVAVFVVLYQIWFLVNQIRYKGRYFEHVVEKFVKKGNTGLSIELTAATLMLRMFILVLAQTAYPMWLVGLGLAATHVINMYWLVDNGPSIVEERKVPPNWLKGLSLVQAVLSVLYLGYYLFGQIGLFAGK
jgi:hypothetical protein